MTKIRFNDNATRAGVEGWYAVEGDFLIFFFEGSNSKRDWIVNIIQSRPGLCFDYKVHEGWAVDMMNAEDVVMGIIVEHPEKRLVFTGHSYGGVIAKGMARLITFPEFVITFGSPKMFFDEIEAPFDVIEFRNAGDWVPWLPPFYKGMKSEKMVLPPWKPVWRSHPKYEFDCLINRVLLERTDG